MKTYLVAGHIRDGYDSIKENDLPSGTLVVTGSQQLRGIRNCILYVDPSINHNGVDSKIKEVIKYYEQNFKDIEVVYLEWYAQKEKLLLTTEGL